MVEQLLPPDCPDSRLKSEMFITKETTPVNNLDESHTFRYFMENFLIISQGYFITNSVHNFEFIF